MNALEKIGMEKLLDHLYKALDRCNVKNQDRMQHERIHLEGEIKRAIETANALKENNS